ncbi:MAG: PqqD family protein [Candidatus Omnitrophica bacterium]|nr:PqqD family protein [Candidatus Omnitrophota bacterium]
MLERYVAKSENIAYRIIDGQALVIFLGTTQSTEDRINVFNETGTRIWELVDGRHRGKDIVDTLCSQFEVAIGVVQEELAQFFNDLQGKRLITFHDSSQR